MFGQNPTDPAVVHQFSVKVDGLEIPHVMEVSGLKGEVDKIEVKQQLSDGKFIIVNVPGQRKSGSIKVTRALTDNAAIQSWLDTVMQGDISGARKNVAVEIKDYKGSTVKTYEFQNCWVTSVEWSGMKAGGTEPTKETVDISYQEWQIT